MSGEPQAPPAQPYAFPPTEIQPPPPPVEFRPAPPPPKADENPVFNGWDVLKVAALTAALALFVVPMITVTFAKIFVFPRQSWLEVAQKPALALVSQFIAYLIVALFMVLLIRGRYRMPFGEAIRWRWPGRAGLNFIGIGVLMLSFDFLAKFLPMPKNTPFDQFFDKPLDAYLTAVFAVTLGPLMEELFFRGFLYPVLARSIGVPVAILLTASGFAVLHGAQLMFSWGPVLVIFLVGVVLTMVRAKTNSVAASVVVHMAYNGTISVAMFAATDGFRHLNKLNQ